MLSDCKRITLSQFLGKEITLRFNTFNLVNCVINELYNLLELDIIRYRDPLSNDKSLQGHY